MAYMGLFGYGTAAHKLGGLFGMYCLDCLELRGVHHQLPRLPVEDWSFTVIHVAAMRVGSVMVRSLRMDRMLGSTSLKH